MAKSERGCDNHAPVPLLPCRSSALPPARRSLSAPLQLIHHPNRPIPSFLSSPRGPIPALPSRRLAVVDSTTPARRRPRRRRPAAATRIEERGPSQSGKLGFEGKTTGMKSGKLGFEGTQEVQHRIRITLSSKSVKNLKKVVEDVVENYRSAQIPLDVIWNDDDHMDARKDFTLSPVNYPRPKLLAFLDML
ncbi:hypothetical protein ZWY2020_026538 [Hordeum vulgare]|nr:hypothetical protein ZWY2020_026538 [Hordeum vulgare]